MERPDQATMDFHAAQAQQRLRGGLQQAKAIAESHRHLIDADLDQTLAEGFSCSGTITVTSLFFFKIDITMTCGTSKLDYTGSGGMLGAGTGTAWGSASFSVPFSEIVGDAAYEAHFTPVYIGINWFRNNIRIGTFNAGGIGVIAGVGGGSGDFYLPTS